MPEKGAALRLAYLEGRALGKLGSRELLRWRIRSRIAACRGHVVRLYGCIFGVNCRPPGPMSVLITHTALRSRPKAGQLSGWSGKGENWWTVLMEQLGYDFFGGDST